MEKSAGRSAIPQGRILVAVTSDDFTVLTIPRPRRSRPAGISLRSNFARAASRPSRCLTAVAETEQCKFLFGMSGEARPDTVRGENHEVSHERLHVDGVDGDDRHHWNPQRAFGSELPEAPGPGQAGGGQDQLIRA